jgi:tryprostatin B 6-hydroxylase
VGTIANNIFIRGLGVYGCIGKPLALMQLRTVLARLVLTFNITITTPADAARFIAETKDQFTFSLADLPLRFIGVVGEK